MVTDNFCYIYVIDFERRMVDKMLYKIGNSDALIIPAVSFIILVIGIIIHLPLLMQLFFIPENRFIYLRLLLCLLTGLLLLEFDKYLVIDVLSTF
jgi:hypothetical protein